MRRAVLSTGSSLRVSPLRACEYREDVKASIEPDVYYIPRSTNQVIFDSFILHDGYLFIFQFTGGNTHQIKTGLITFLAQCANLPERDKWRLVFIIPDDVGVLKCPYPRSAELHEVKLFSSVLAMKPRWKPPTSRSAIEMKSEEEGEADRPAPAKRSRHS
jgi:hypothetical protein